MARGVFRIFPARLVYRTGTRREGIRRISGRTDLLPDLDRAGEGRNPNSRRRQNAHRLETSIGRVLEDMARHLEQRQARWQRY